MHITFTNGKLGQIKVDFHSAILAWLSSGTKLRVCSCNHYYTVHILKRDSRKDKVIRILNFENFEYLYDRGWIKESGLSKLLRDINHYPLNIKYYRLTDSGRAIASSIWERLENVDSISR